MRYIIAIIACVAETFVYAFIGVFLLEWRHGGGILPMMILIAIWVATWRAITKEKNSTAESTQSGTQTGVDKPDEKKQEPFVGFQDIPEQKKETKAAPPLSLTEGKE